MFHYRILYWYSKATYQLKNIYLNETVGDDSIFGGEVKSVTAGLWLVLPHLVLKLDVLGMKLVAVFRMLWQFLLQIDSVFKKSQYIVLDIAIYHIALPFCDTHRMHTRFLQIHISTSHVVLFQLC